MIFASAGAATAAANPVGSGEPGTASTGGAECGADGATSGPAGFVTRALVLAAIPLVLYAARFFRPGELTAARRLLARRAQGAPASG